MCTKQGNLATMPVSALSGLACCHPLFVILPEVCVCLQARKGDRCGHCVSGTELEGADRGAGDSGPPCSSCRLLL